MHASTFFVATALQATLTAAIGNAVVSNRCPYDIWVQNVAANNPSEMIKVPSHSKWSTPLSTSLASVKISKTDSIVPGEHTQFEYSVADDKLWYNLSFVNCAEGESADACPGHDLGLSMNSPDNSCGQIDCAAGSYCPTQAYYVDQPLIKLGINEPVFNCASPGADKDLNMEVCSSEAKIGRSIAGRIQIADE